jgi:Ca2+-binding EF-hand superfamily protein
MVLLDSEKLTFIEKVFTNYGEEGLSLPQFISLIINSIQHPKEERIDLVYGLVRLFKEIDINGDEKMEWGEFTQYLIETLIGDDGIGGNKNGGSQGRNKTSKTDCKSNIR